MLKCVSRYSSSLGTFVPGDVIEDPRLEKALAQDSPESFVDAEVQADMDQELVVEQQPRIRGYRRKA